MKQKFNLLATLLLLSFSLGFTSCGDKNDEPESLVVQPSSILGTWRADYTNYEGFMDIENGLMANMPWIENYNADWGSLYFYYSYDGTGFRIGENNVGVVFEKFDWNLKNNALTLKWMDPDVPSGAFAATYLITGIKNNVMNIYTLAGLASFNKVSDDVLSKYRNLINDTGLSNTAFKVDDSTPKLIYLAYCSQHANSVNFILLYSDDDEKIEYNQFSFRLRNTSYANIKVGDNVTEIFQIYLFGADQEESMNNRYVSGNVYVQSISDSQIVLNFNNYKFANDYSEEGYAVLNGTVAFDLE